MTRIRNPKLPIGGPAPAPLGFNAVAPEWLCYGAADAAPAIPAAESTLGSHPCVALSSAQVLPEWINRNLAANDFASDGDYPLNFVSHSRGSLHAGHVVSLDISPHRTCVGRFSNHDRGAGQALSNFSALVVSNVE